MILRKQGNTYVEKWTSNWYLIKLGYFRKRLKWNVIWSHLVCFHRMPVINLLYKFCLWQDLGQEDERLLHRVWSLRRREFDEFAFLRTGKKLERFARWTKLHCILTTQTKEQKGIQNSKHLTSLYETCRNTSEINQTSF